VTTLTPLGPVGEEIIPGGRSGFFLSPFYTNQLRLWLVNDYLPLNIGEDAAIQASANIKVFAPQQ
jgi:penicillin amidase